MFSLWKMFCACVFTAAPREYSEWSTKRRVAARLVDDEEASGVL
jgi:hypothetical protein